MLVYHAGGGDYVRDGYAKQRFDATNMRIYHVSPPHSGRATYQGRTDHLAVGVLAAYEGRGQTTFDFVTKLVGNGRRVLLDSGAFGAWRSGHPRDLGRYIEVCRALAPIVDAYAALDVIGDHRATLVNHERMLAAGLDPIPTFHVGEPDDALDALLALRPRYLGLGGLVGRSRKERTEWLDRVWSRLVRDDGWPFRVHGWGVTDATLIPRYPWASVDSSTAVAKVKSIPAGLQRGRVDTDNSSAGKHGLVRIRQATEAVEETVNFATEKWAARGIIWE